MSLPNRPSFQKPTKASSSSSSSSSTGGAAGARWNGNYSAGVSPVRGLSPVRSTFHGSARQDIDMARSHTNPLFSSRTSDIGRLNNTPTKAGKDSKENREKQEPWKVPAEKAQYSGKTLCTTPGKSSRTSASMRFTTPPKPVVKRRILAENRELATGTPRMKEDIAAKTPRKEVMAEPATVSRSRTEESQCRVEDGPSSLSPERGSSGDSSKPKSPLVSIEELQKRIQKFLQDEGTSAAVSVSMSPRQSTESIRRSLSGTASCEESSLTGVEEAPFQPVVAPYSPRPEYVRARKSPTPPVSMEGNASPLRGEESLIQEKTTPTYDPKNNFLSPRPQFLRYRPLRRLELLRKSAEGTLADLDLESPATDAESSRMGSEKDEKEESECQDVSQEAQSLKSSFESPPRCKVASHELFKSAEIIGEIVQLRAEEPEQSISSTKPPPLPEAHAGWDVPSNPSELEDEVELEDADSNDNSSNALYTAFNMVTVVALVALLVVASGSPSLLPTPLHQNHISHLWKTARATEPIRQFLQTTEGLWAENKPSPSDFALSSPDIFRLGWVRISSLVQSVDFSTAIKNGKVLWSSCMEHGARFGRFTKESLLNFTASLDEDMDFHSSHNQEVNEWDWVPDYEFVVPHDMFDPAEAYANIMARVESLGVKSFWSSIIQTYAKPSFVQRVVEETKDPNLGGTMDGNNSSMCWLSARPDAPGVSGIPVSRPGEDLESNSKVPKQSEEVTVIYPHEHVVCIGADNAAEAPGEGESFPSPAMEGMKPNSKVPAQTEEGTIVYPHELNAISEGIVGQGILLSVQNGQELEVGNDVTALGVSDVVSVGADNPAEAAGEVESFESPAAEGIPLSPGVEVVELSHNDTEKSQLAGAVEDFQDLEPDTSHDNPLSFHESLEEESLVRQGTAESVPVPSFSEENEIDSYRPQETKQETARSLTLEKLLNLPAAFATSVLVAASSVVALLVVLKINARSGNSRRLASLKASAHRLSKPLSIEPQFKAADRFQPVEDIVDNDFFVEASSAGQLSSEFIKQFSTPYPVTVGTPDRMLGNVIGMDLTSNETSSSAGQLSSEFIKQFSTLYPVTVGTPDRKLGNVIGMDLTSNETLTQVFHGDTSQSPDKLSPGILEESSLGRFTTLVPVVHNEGTARERVQLTPVRRSSRIRTRMQNSPCTLMHSPHLCNCD